MSAHGNPKASPRVKPSILLPSMAAKNSLSPLTTGNSRDCHRRLYASGGRWSMALWVRRSL